MNKIKQVALILSAVIALTGQSIVLAQETESPVDLLKRTSDEVIRILNDEKEQLQSDSARIYQIVDNYILPHLDDVTMAKLALGKNWRKASNEQKIEFVDQFRTLLVRTYSASLLEFSDQTIRFFPLKAADEDTKVVVKSEVLQTGGPTVPISYRMRLKDDAWKVYDVSIDGVSLVTSYRGTFAQEMRKGGMTGILEMLQEKNSKVLKSSPSKDKTTMSHLSHLSQVTS